MKKSSAPHHNSVSSIIKSSLCGLVLLAGSIAITYIAGSYATANEGNPVNDLILDHIPAMNVEDIFIDGFVLFFIVVAALVIHRPKRIPFVFKSFALFNLVRSFFIILTHLGPSVQQIPLDANSRIVHAFTFTGDLFFSGHTGLPFLMALVFWQERTLRWTFMATSIFFGAIVLLGHFHYSIDVFSAFFITYGIFQIALRMFPKDYNLLCGKK